MDMTLELGNSMASLGARTQNRLKYSTTLDGSFMVVPPGSSYMSSSLWASGMGGRATGAPAPATNTAATTTTTRTRNRVQPAAPPVPPRIAAPPTQSTGLESSWWGNTTSQILASSSKGDAVHTKQLMQLLDSIKVLGDENAALLREVQEADAARMEAKTARDQMRQFRQEYGQRFQKLKEALETFRKSHSAQQDNPVTNR